MASIKTLPEDFLEKVEFDRVVALQVAEALGPGGRALCAEPAFYTEAGRVADRLELANDMLRSLGAEEAPPLRPYDDLAHALRMLELENYTMSLEELVQINLLLRDQLAAYRHFEDVERKDRYGRLAREVLSVAPAPELNAAIDKIVDDDGNIRPDASPELARLRRGQQTVQREIDDKFRGLVQRYRERDLLSDTVESFRNGRRVLSVPASNKRKIRGIIHDESSTGQTAYIEPEEVIPLNNDLFDLRAEEKREIARLLRELSATLRPALPQLKAFEDARSALDCLRAQAVIARRLAANRPEVQQAPTLHMLEARHPLLYLKFEKEGRRVVPFDLRLDHPNRMLLLSGPNAGGKSIMLKGAGLLQTMVQCGMLVPCSPESHFGMFDTLCADIGDQQSLEDDLSTYSSHLRNMRGFLRVAGPTTFVLIDEFGSGTDPNLGGAIAESILKRLNKAQCWGVITTHYGNLKAFVFKQRGLLNGAMIFDVDTLAPTYELRVGKPGSSYAFEVATKAGIDAKILAYAKTRVRGSEHEVDALLVNLEREKGRAETLAGELERERSKLNRLSGTYARMQKDLEVQRKTFKLESEERALQAEARHQKELEGAMRKMREAERSEEAKKLVLAQREQRREREEKVQDLREELNEVGQKSAVLKRDLRPGDHVKLRRGGSAGVVESIDKGRAVVKMGALRMTANLRDLEGIQEQLDIRRSPSVKKSLREIAGGFKPELDVRGFRREEVLNLVQDFVDRGMIENAAELKILHGKGNGTLRRTVREKLKEYREVQARHPAAEEGGDGVTLVRL